MKRVLFASLIFAFSSQAYAKVIGYHCYVENSAGKSVGSVKVDPTDSATSSLKVNKLVFSLRNDYGTEEVTISNSAGETVASYSASASGFLSINEPQLGLKASCMPIYSGDDGG
jgi:hypothetical protein